MLRTVKVMRFLAYLQTNHLACLSLMDVGRRQKRTMTDTEGSLLPRVIIIVRLTFVFIPQAQLP